MSILRATMIAALAVSGAAPVMADVGEPPTFVNVVRAERAAAAEPDDAAAPAFAPAPAPAAPAAATEAPPPQAAALAAPATTGQTALENLG